MTFLEDIFQDLWLLANYIVPVFHWITWYKTGPMFRLEVTGIAKYFLQSRRIAWKKQPKQPEKLENRQKITTCLKVFWRSEDWKSNKNITLTAFFSISKGATFRHFIKLLVFSLKNFDRLSTAQLFDVFGHIFKCLNL